MTIQTTMNDRKELARMLIPFNHNEKLHYAGTPTFALKGMASASFVTVILNEDEKQKPPSRLSCRTKAFCQCRKQHKNRNQNPLQWLHPGMSRI